ncbi:putative DNA-directed RNA polymerase, RBP11-like dimerization domain-containing protein [Helianthus annuus]|nr:putative DNA-directed RNA polymerase, RBP11-like dimerization domain-containing protein [Helianthus annuus]
MEHGSYKDQSASTFSLAEDHTPGERSKIYSQPRVSTFSVCGYSIPHPSEARVNIRVQTTGDPAKEVLKDSCQDLMMICQHVRSTFDQVVADFKNNNGF